MGPFPSPRAGFARSLPAFRAPAILWAKWGRILGPRASPSVKKAENPREPIEVNSCALNSMSLILMKQTHCSYPLDFQCHAAKNSAILANSVWSCTGIQGRSDLPMPQNEPGMSLRFRDLQPEGSFSKARDRLRRAQGIAPYPPVRPSRVLDRSLILESPRAGDVRVGRGRAHPAERSHASEDCYNGPRDSSSTIIRNGRRARCGRRVSAGPGDRVEAWPGPR